MHWHDVIPRRKKLLVLVELLLGLVLEPSWLRYDGFWIFPISITILVKTLSHVQIIKSHFTLHFITSAHIDYISSKFWFTALVKIPPCIFRFFFHCCYIVSIAITYTPFFMQFYLIARILFMCETFSKLHTKGQKKKKVYNVSAWLCNAAISHDNSTFSLVYQVCICRIQAYKTQITVIAGFPIVNHNNSVD